MQQQYQELLQQFKQHKYALHRGMAQPGRYYCLASVVWLNLLQKRKHYAVQVFYKEKPKVYLGFPTVLSETTAWLTCCFGPCCVEQHKEVLHPGMAYSGR